MNLNNPLTNELVRAVLSLKTIEEARRFFRDLMTEEEILEFGRRWKAAQMLDSRIPYTKIIEKTGLSSTTVARVSKWLNSGMDGYKLVLSRLNHHHTGNKTLAKRLA